MKTKAEVVTSLAEKGHLDLAQQVIAGSKVEGAFLDALFGEPPPDISKDDKTAFAQIHQLMRDINLAGTDNQLAGIAKELGLAKARVKRLQKSFGEEQLRKVMRTYRQRQKLRVEPFDKLKAETQKLRDELEARMDEKKTKLYQAIDDSDASELKKMIAAL
jgi:hypothetical protein